MNLFVLFLDIDGVLHRGTTGTVRHAAALAEVLAKFPEVRIVVSSTWRFQNSLKDLKGWFPPSLAQKMVDVTPVLEHGKHLRQQEIEAWLSRHPTKHWLALDDEAALFEPGYAKLLLTDPTTGLTRSDLQALEQILTASLATKA